MNMNTLKYNPFVIVFFLLYTLYSIKSGFFSLAIKNEFIFRIKDITNISIISMALFFSFLLSKNKTKIYLIVFNILSIIGLVYFHNKFYLGFLLTISMLTLTSKIKWEVILKIIIFSNAITILFLCFSVYFSEYYFLEDDRFGRRFTAGFDNPNTLGQYILMLFTVISLFLELKVKNPSTRLIITTSIFIIIFTILYLTYSRTSLILSSLFYITIIYSILLKKNNHFLPRIKLKYLILFSSLFFIFLQFYFIINFKENNFLYKINDILTSRLWFGNILYSSLGFPNLLIGTNIEKYFPIDFYFIQTIYSIGLIPFIFLYFLAIRNLFNTNITSLMGYTLLIMLLETMTETYFSVPFYSIALFIIFSKKI
ncbi:hypothetical protein I8U97_002540 [Proteus mirabilis]|nr:hypothetical protein [Proteus mirabilis]KZE61334.1 hypothetical protein AV652_08315 [Proteus mirabilis]